MDLAKIGKFIQERRKEKGLTQVQLSQKIGVSEKTVSKWECGYGFPDTTLMLPLCKVLGINANELLSGKILRDDAEYKVTAEENILLMANQDRYKNKMMLTLEWVIGYMSVLILLICAMIVSFVDMPFVWRILIIIFGFINCMIGVAFALKIEKDAGYYACGHCNHRYIPSYKSVIWSMHMGRTRYMKCPKCGKKSWNRKVVDKDVENK